MTEVNSSSESVTIPDKENGKSNHNSTSASPKGKVDDGKIQRQECNGNMNDTEGEREVEKDGLESNAMASHGARVN